ncbi:LD-carboxypeptidase [Altererythrobacter aerius]|uniref:LD-carboxypeptidase n=1 Tax=Tsuneonella aeria TaxID=1837929 RepID=A0A6I4TCH4_9SPHN|nr:LD-carboxypeptidase [Tsuneonella aeria]MXO73925.1 LD-carboxypeptidase [Tsuneonella aeria]
MTRVAICAPATPITRDVAAEVTALAASEFPALDLDFHEQCFAQEGHFAGPDALRLSALLECANDPSAEAVWFAKGGYGSNRIASEAVTGLGANARGKTFMGYSDCGFLLAALYRERIGRPVHGPMPLDIRRDGGSEAIRRALQWFSSDAAGQEPRLDGRPTVAFNLMTLATLIGTPLMPDLRGHVVIVEEVAEHLYAIDRLFFHVAANLTGVAGIRLGMVTAVPENDRPFGSEAEDIARYWCERASIPYLGRAEVGHHAANRIVPFGLAAPARRA